MSDLQDLLSVGNDEWDIPDYDLGNDVADKIDAAEAAAKNDWERGFVASVSEQFAKWGRITGKQVAVLDKIIASVKPRVDRQVAVQALDLSVIPSGRYSVPGGDTRLKLKIDNVTEGKWAGYVFVKDAAEYGHGKRYGSQAPGGVYRGEIVDALRAILADPFEASKAYGRLVGVCGVCGRHLEDPVSVANGIGPICAEKF